MLKKLTIFCAFVFSSALVIYASPIEHELTEDVVFAEDFFLNQEFLTAVELYNIEQFGESRLYNERNAINIFEDIYASFARNRMGDVIYPEFFGGAFLDNEGNLVVNIVANAVVPFADVSILDNISRNVSNIQLVEFSMNNLNDTINYFNLNDVSLFGEGSSDSYWWPTSWGIDTMKNRVVVGLYNYSTESQALFLESVGHLENIIFEQGQIAMPLVGGLGIWDEHEILDNHNEVHELNPFNVININPGGRVWLNANSHPNPLYRHLHARLTMGFRVNRGGVNGFVTAPHGLATHNAVATESSLDLFHHQFGGVTVYIIKFFSKYFKNP